MECWYCHWGWPKPIADIYERAVKDLHEFTDPLHFGPAHVVWEDENFEPGHAEWCLEKFDENYAVKGKRYKDWEFEIVRRSLEDLVRVDPVYRTPPDGFDDLDDAKAEDYPPPDDWEMVRVT